MTRSVHAGSPLLRTLPVQADITVRHGHGLQACLHLQAYVLLIGATHCTALFWLAAVACVSKLSFQFFVKK